MAEARLLPPIFLAEVDSTNAWVRAHAAHLADGQWVFAGRQTAGRGRLGRVWQMAEGNLAASCCLHAGGARAAEFSFVAALALHDSCCEWVAPSRLQLKWPNDLLLDGAKLSGILLEREGPNVVLGIGVNLTCAPALSDRATVALATVGAEIAPGTFLARLMAHFARRRQDWAISGFAAVRSDWLARAHLPGSRLWLVNEGRHIAGIFRGLADDGALLLEDDAGEMLTIHAGDTALFAPQAANV